MPIVNVTLHTPIKGYHEGYPRGAQPPVTSPSMRNVRPRSRSGRHRMSVRPGLNLAATVGTGKIQYVGFMKFRGYSTTLGGTNGPNTNHPNTQYKTWGVWIVVSGGTVYYGESLSSMTSAGSGLSTTGQVSGALFGQGTNFGTAPPWKQFQAAAFFADTAGTLKMLRFTWTVTFSSPNWTIVSAVTLGALSDSEGGTAPAGGTTVAVWNSRLVVGDDQGFWKMSRVGEYRDWNADDADPARAVDGSVFMSSIPNASMEPVVAWIPWTDGVLYMFTDRRCWRFNGDPANGGSIQLANSELAILGPNAWTGDAQGGLWVAASGGLYRSDGGAFARVDTDAVPSFFSSPDRSNYFVSLFWERAEQSLHVQFTPSAGGGVHLFHDVRNGGFWPYAYPSACGPFCAYVHDGDAATDRVTYVGGADGKIFNLDATLASDETATDTYTAIDAYCYLGPLKPYGDSTEAVLLTAQFVLGEVPSGFTESANWRADYVVQAGDDEYEAVVSPDQTVSGSYLGAGGTDYTGKQGAVGLRMAGGAHAVKISNGNAAARLFEFERVELEFEEGR